jgi:hypothetical protein
MRRKDHEGKQEKMPPRIRVKKGSGRIGPSGKKKKEFQLQSESRVPRRKRLAPI